MLSSINFLFLLSLGFVSWSILCYIHQIEQFINLNINLPRELPKKVSVLEEISTKTTPQSPQIMRPATSNDDKYEFYVNFLCIFVCIYALAKITHLAELYLGQRIRRKIYLPTIQNQNLHELESLSDLQQQQKNLTSKIITLEKQNYEMKSKLNRVAENQAQDQTNLEEQIQNIFINNKYIHLNRQIYVNQGVVPNMKYENQNGEQPCVWEKYMELKNLTSHRNNTKMSNYMPVVMSIEELENIKAFEI